MNFKLISRLRDFILYICVLAFYFAPGVADVIVLLAGVYFAFKYARGNKSELSEFSATVCRSGCAKQRVYRRGYHCSSFLLLQRDAPAPGHAMNS